MIMQAVFCTVFCLKCPLSAKYIVLFDFCFILDKREGHLGMVEQIVTRLVAQMEDRKIIEKSSKDYYEYVLITLVEHVIGVGTMMIIGMLFKQFIPTVIFLLFFLSLRKRTGGYHADKFWQCYLATIITYIGIIQMAAVLAEKTYIMYAILFLAVLVIEIIGTVNHPNIDMNKSELQENKKSARLLVLMEAAVIVLLVILEINQLYVSYMSIAIILCSFLMCLAKMLKQEVKVK